MLVCLNVPPHCSLFSDHECTARWASSFDLFFSNLCVNRVSGAFDANKNMSGAHLLVGPRVRLWKQCGGFDLVGPAYGSKLVLKLLVELVLRVDFLRVEDGHWGCVRGKRGVAVAQPQVGSNSQ